MQTAYCPQFVCVSHSFQTLLDFCAKKFLWGILRLHFIIITFQRHRCFVGFYLPVKSLPQHNVGLRGWVGTKGPMLYTLGPWFLWNLVVQFSLVHIFKKQHKYPAYAIFTTIVKDSFTHVTSVLLIWLLRIFAKLSQEPVFRFL